MKRSSFRRKSSAELWEAKIKKDEKLKQALDVKKPALRRTKLRLVGVSSTAELKKEIQATLREIVIKRDGGCFLRNYSKRITPQYSQCGGYRKDGELILQAEHLHTRSNAASFSDSRLVVCVCRNHHIYYKPQHSVEYNELAREYIGEANAKLWDYVRQDRLSHKLDLKVELMALKQELKKLSTGYT